MYTFQDFEKAADKVDFLLQAIGRHEASEEMQIAKDADEYDKQKNVTIINYLKTMYSMSGEEVVDFTASNAKITSNFYHRINTQRKNYLLGNGVTFNEEETKEALGEKFDHVVSEIAYNAMKHGVSYGFWNFDELHVFKFTEFVPLLDEETSALRAGIRYWQLSSDKPLYVVLYEEDGFTKYCREIGEASALKEVAPKKSYVQKVAYTEADGEQIIGETNYGSLPIIPMWGNSHHQSTLVGTREAIDSYDLVRSGFANDLTDVAQIYWIVENAAGMSEGDLARFRDRMKIQHIVTADTTDGTKIQPYTQNIPYQARKIFLDDLKAQIYEDFGALDVHMVSASSTNDHLEAAYQPLDEETDDLEYNVTEFIQQLLRLIGIDDYPTYKRNKISNQAQQTAMVLSAADYLDPKTILNHLPFITVDEVEDILEELEKQNEQRFAMENGEGEEMPEEEGEDMGAALDDLEAQLNSLLSEDEDEE